MQKNEFHYFARKTKSDCHYFAKKMQNESRLKPSNSANQKNDNQNFYRRNLLFSTLQNNVYTVKHSNDDDGDDGYVLHADAHLPYGCGAYELLSPPLR